VDSEKPSPEELAAQDASTQSDPKPPTLPPGAPPSLLVASNYGGKLGVARTALFTRPLILDCAHALPSRCSSRHLPMHGSVSYERAPLWQRCTTRGSPSSTTQARRPMAVLELGDADRASPSVPPSSLRTVSPRP
jgi:hypothetical protein